MSETNLSPINSSALHNKFKDLIDEDSAPRKTLNSIAEKAEKIGELLTEFGSIDDKLNNFKEIVAGDKSLEEKLGNFKELLGEDSSVGKIMDLVETLPKEARSIINALNVVREHGLPADHLEGIIAFKELS